MLSWRLLGLGLAAKLCLQQVPNCGWIVTFTHNLLTVHRAGGRCTWHSDVIVPQCLAFVGFVSCQGDFLLPESCPTWLWVTHLCVEDRRVSTGQRHWWTKNSRKVKTTGGRSQNWAKFGESVMCLFPLNCKPTGSSSKGGREEFDNQGWLQCIYVVANKNLCTPHCQCIVAVYIQRKDDLTPVSSVIELTSGISGTSEPPSLF